jgi:peptide/nickel transport system ATP-binding protein
LSPPILQIRDLRTALRLDGGWITVVDGVSLEINAGRCTALVGESGCGKTLTALSILRLLPPRTARIEGRVLFTEPEDGQPRDLLQFNKRELLRVRGRRIGIIFQEPLSALNPVLTVSEQLVEVLELHRSVGRRGAWKEGIELLRRVGIPAPEVRIHEYPHRLSGGMAQRVLLAMALAGRPAVLIADEPTTALDVTVQRQVLELIRSIQSSYGLGVLLITHDLGIVAQYADAVYVMYAGRIIEYGPVVEVLTDPLHPYTRALLACTTGISQPDRPLEGIPGKVPEPANFPEGCRFYPRCRRTAERARKDPSLAIAAENEFGGKVLRQCLEPEPDLTVGPTLLEFRPGHFVACPEV